MKLMVWLKHQQQQQQSTFKHGLKRANEIEKKEITYAHQQKKTPLQF